MSGRVHTSGNLGAWGTRRRGLSKRAYNEASIGARLTHFIGVDVQESKPCSYAVLDEDAQLVQSGWLTYRPAECVGRL